MEHPICTLALEQAANGELDLVVPAFCIGETYDVLGRRRKQHSATYRAIRDGTHELARSEPYREEAQAIQGLMSVFERSAAEEQRRLEVTPVSLLDTATLIPTNAETIRLSIALQASHLFAPQDAVIYASILRHLDTALPEPKCFVTKNAKDFMAPSIRAELAAHDCRVVTSFNDALRYLRSRAQSS